MNESGGIRGAEKVAMEFDTPSFSLALEFDVDEMECRVSITPKSGGDPVTPDALIKLFDTAGIKTEIDHGALVKLCQKMPPPGVTSDKVLVASGIPPKSGIDGSLKLQVQSFSDDPTFKSDSKGRINYHERHAFENVEIGQLIGRILPPQQGAPGTTVTGIPVPGEFGQALNIIAGKGIRIDSDAIYAESDGRLICDNDTLSVTDEFIVDGDVDLHVGHINFNGFVNIKGDLLDGFNVKATKGIQVAGSVGACQVVAGGDIKLGSMFGGKGQGIIKCTGNLYAQYLGNVAVESQGDIIVGKEIRDSSVKALGCIQVAGTISGGECISLAGIEAIDIGSVIGSKTIIISGRSYLDSDLEAGLKKRLDVISFQEKNINHTVGKATPELFDTLSDVVKHRISMLVKTLEKITQEKDIIFEELKGFAMSRQDDNANPKINVKRRLHEGVTIEIGNVKENILFERNGPVSIVESKKNNCLLYLLFSPLNVKADSLAAENNG